MRNAPAGVDARAQVETRVALRGLHFHAQRLAQFEQGQPAEHRAFGVVLACFMRPEGRRQTVASVRQHLALARAHDGRATCKRVVPHGADGFGVQALGQQGGARHVKELDTDLFEGLGGFGRRGRCGPQRDQSGAKTGHRRINNCVAEHAPLGLPSGDPGFELLLGQDKHTPYQRLG
jgi:hypothetical protein